MRSAPTSLSPPGDSAAPRSPDSAGFGPAGAAAQPLRLNIGCGEQRRAGFLGIDVRPCAAADHVRPAWDLQPFAPGSVDEVYSRHMLEHLDPNDARRALQAWRAALRPGGFLRLIVPDLAFHAQQLLGGATSFDPHREANERHALAGFFGWRDESRGGNREDAHRWGYTEQTLRALLEDCGFVDVQRVRDGEDSAAWHLHLTARRPAAGDESQDETPADAKEGAAMSAKRRKRRAEQSNASSAGTQPAGGSEREHPSATRAAVADPAAETARSTAEFDGRPAAVTHIAAGGASQPAPQPALHPNPSREPAAEGTPGVALPAGQSASAPTAQAAAQRVLADWRGRGRVAVFGAGAHTRKILPTLLAHADRIAGIADDSPAAWGTTIGRWVVAPPRQVIDESVGGVLVSSDTAQHPLAARVRRDYGDRCAVLTLYAESVADDGPTLPDTGERQVGRSLEEIEIGHRARYYWALQHLPAGARVLDAACGNGYGSRILADGGAALVFGVDVCDAAVRFAQHYFGNPQTCFAAAELDDARSLRLAAERRGPFEAVVSLETLEHLESPQAFLSAARTLLRPAGMLYCSTPNAEAMPLNEAPFHRRHYSLREFKNLLANSGFALVDWYGQEGMQILRQRAGTGQRYCLYVAQKA